MVYNSQTCSDTVSGDIVVFLPGTSLIPESYRNFVKWAGDLTGQCIIAIPYENDFTNGTCCTLDENPDGPQSADCLMAEYGAKSHGAPATFECRDGKTYEVSYDDSIEGRTGLALLELGLEDYYTLFGDQIQVKWDKLFFSGHSQGAQFSLYLAMNRHQLAGIGLFAGGVYKLENGDYEAWAYETPLTDPQNFRAFHHVEDADSLRQEVYEFVNIPSSNIRTTDYESTGCDENAHSCTITDAKVPIVDEEPVFADDWAWVVNGKQ